VSRIFNILCIDDDHDDVVLIEDVLLGAARATFMVARAATYQEGLRLLLSGNHYDAVLLDHQMGVKTGIDMLIELEARKWDKSPIIMLTGLSPEVADQDAVSHGACDLLTKTEAVSVPQLLERSIYYAVERHAQRMAIRESEERYALAVQGSQGGIFDWQIDDGKFYVSEHFKEILGLRRGQLVSLDGWRQKIHPEDGPAFDRALSTHLAGESTVLKNDHRIHTLAGDKWVRVRGVAVLDDDKVPRRVSGSLHDITIEKMAEHKIVHAATHDQLTALSNRVKLHDLLSEQLETVADNPAHSFSVVYVDLDRFKQLNDGLGHLIGDEVLMESARRLLKAVGDQGVVSRHGGDEFVMVLKVSDRVSLDIAESIVKAFRHPISLHNGGKHIVTASVGLLHSRPGYNDPASLLRDADLAMYKAKKRGRDQLVVFDDRMREKALRRFRLERDFREALKNGDLTVVYQPIVSAETGKTVALEALSRWTHGIAEESGLVVELGKYTLKQAALDVRSWPERGDVSVGINVSPVEMMDPEFLDRFQRVARKVPKGSIGIEITETAIVQNEKHIVELLEKLKKEGVYVHLDDFGTGYASMSHIVNLPLGGVKVDMSLTREVNKPRAQAAIKAVLELAHNLGMYCICEGVEDDRQKKILKNLGMDFVQGYLISKPMPATEVNDWLRKN
jgi:diguanylate cyclase (GGDEF)-like protein/PAS domain S-box-containing protein